jgi:hypothetical protein
MIFRILCSLGVDPGDESTEADPIRDSIDASGSDPALKNAFAAKSLSIGVKQQQAK